MTSEDRIARLEGLLERVQRNRSRSRAQPAKPALEGIVPRAAFTPAPPAASAPPASPAPVAEAPPQVTAGSFFSAEPGSSVQARPSSIPPEELTDDDLVEVTTLPPAADVPAVTATADLELAAAAEQEEQEEAPASSRRSKVAESLDQAIASAADRVEEVPIHTPPPESGPQEAVLPAGIESPRAPEFPDLDAGELERPASLGPTPEQLGETIELDEPMGPELEIEMGGLPRPPAAPERPVEELELALPRAELPSGTYDRSLAEPSEPPTVTPPASAPPVEAAAAELTPERIERPEVAEAEVTHVVRVRDKLPETFAELLDGSLAL